MRPACGRAPTASKGANRGQQRVRIVEGSPHPARRDRLSFFLSSRSPPTPLSFGIRMSSQLQQSPQSLEGRRRQEPVAFRRFLPKPERI